MQLTPRTPCSSNKSVITLDRSRRARRSASWERIRNRDLSRTIKNLTISETGSRLKEFRGAPDGPHHVVVSGETGAGCLRVPGSRSASRGDWHRASFLRAGPEQRHDRRVLKAASSSRSRGYLLDKYHHELGHFIERPKHANEQIHVTREVLGDTSPEGIAKRLGHEPSEEEVAAARAEARTRYMEWQKGETWAGWRVATVDEVIDLLRSKLG